MIKVTVQENPHSGGNYPTYYIVNDGVVVGPAGDLTLISMWHPDDNQVPVEFRIYAPGTWKEINATYVEDGED